MNSMPSPTRTLRFLGAFAGLAVSTALAQQTNKPLPLPRTRRPPPAAAAEETIVLSPFVVQGEVDTGYVATDSLAGTRLRTPLRDIATSVTVVTRDFLEDVNATNIGELLVYTTGTEVSGVTVTMRSGREKTGGTMRIRSSRSPTKWAEPVRTSMAARDHAAASAQS